MTKQIAHPLTSSKWTFKQTLMTRITYAIIDMNSRTGVTESLSVKKGEDDRFQIIEPSASTFYQGALAYDHLKPTSIGSTWFPEARKQDISSKTVVLYLHGGGLRILLNTLHIPAGQIVLAGDSAELKLPPPKCCVLISPWTAPYDLNIKSSPNFNSDWLPPLFLKWGASTYGSSMRAPETHRYITPLGNPFKTSTPTFVNYGSAEIFDANITQWAQEMKNEGNAVEIHREVNAPHDTFLLGEFLGFEESARDVAVKVGSFIAKH
ncbi:alpha/beta hydrolase fold-3 domain-containing protein [Xylariaceae sp. FL0255]|nr:alpha/beta hydrolase fold-3 domain-containing protein [Xylariaceae sp. FL0255]